MISRVKILVKYLIISTSVLMMNISVANEVTVPIISKEGKVYLSLSVHLEKYDSNTIYHKKMLETLGGVIQDVSNKKVNSTADNYYQEDGTKIQTLDGLKAFGFDGFKLYTNIKDIDPKYVLKWGRYTLLSLIYKLNDSSEFAWREDFVCEVKQGCLISTTFASNQKNQLFEIAYIKLKNTLGNTQNLITEKSDSGISSKAYPDLSGFEEKAVNESTESPLLVYIDIDSTPHKVCMGSCENSSSGLQLIDNVSSELTRLKKEFDKNGVNGLLSKIESGKKNFTGEYIRKVQWSDKKPIEVFSKVDSFLKGLLNRDELLILGTMQDNDYLYLLYDTTEPKYKEGKLLIEKASEDMQYNIIVFKVLDDGKTKLWLDETKKFTLNVLFSPLVMKTIHKRLFNEI